MGLFYRIPNRLETARNNQNRKNNNLNDEGEKWPRSLRTA
ncbi:hypothetical protein BRUCa_1440 [Brucella melitensis]